MQDHYNSPPQPTQSVVSINTKWRLRIFISALFLLPALLISGQSNNSYRSFEHWYLGLNLGSASFYGDISHRTNAFSGGMFRDRDFVYGLTLTKKFGPMFWTKLNLLTGTLSSTNEGLDLSFKSDIVEVSAVGMLSLTDIFLGDDPDRPVNAYLFFGPGLVSFRSWKRVPGTDSLIDADGTGNNKGLGFVVPMGVGVDYRVTEQFTVTGEFSIRNVRTDRIDAHTDISRVQEGYGYINLGLHYQFEMPEGILKRNNRHTGKSSDPALKAYNKRKSTVMKTKGYREGMKTKRRIEREKKEWLILKLFRKTRLDMATE